MSLVKARVSFLPVGSVALEQPLGQILELTSDRARIVMVRYVAQETLQRRQVGCSGWRNM